MRRPPVRRRCGCWCRVSGLSAIPMRLCRLSCCFSRRLFRWRGMVWTFIYTLVRPAVPAASAACGRASARRMRSARRSAFGGRSSVGSRYTSAICWSGNISWGLPCVRLGALFVRPVTVCCRSCCGGAGHRFRRLTARWRRIGRILSAKRRFPPLRYLSGHPKISLSVIGGNSIGRSGSLWPFIR